MTSLQKQLAAIAASTTHQLDLKAQKAAHGKSLLYEPKVAASQSFESLYVICYEGYRDLCALDQRFLPFAKTLFSEQSKNEDRTQMTKKENEKLDQWLESFMTLVGPRILLKPAEKALEWLVRRFRVHEYNTECLVLTYLPYHATPQFLSLLSILPSNPPHALRFLHPYLTPPTNPPRRTIVYTAANTPNFFTSLQKYIVEVLRRGHEGPTLLSFWSGVTAQAVDAILEQSQSGRREVQEQRVEEVLLRVLPVLNECLKMTNIPEALMGSYMIIVILVTKGNFPEKVLDSLLEAVIRSQTTESMEGALMCMSVIAEERTTPRFPAAVTKRIFNLTNLVPTLQALSGKYRVERFALGCALGALEMIGRGSRQDESVALFRGIVAANLLDDSQLSLSCSVVLQLIKDSPPGSSQHGQLIELASKLSESPRTRATLQDLMRERHVEFESVGLSIDQPMETTMDLDEEDDEEMLDADMVDSGLDAVSITPPKITVTSFLDAKASEDFRATLAAFEQVASTAKRATGFLKSEELGRNEAAKKPLFLSFLARTWCTPTSNPSKLTALRSATVLIKELNDASDLQHLIPYLICTLADPVPAVRRAAATCIGALSEKAAAAEKNSKYGVWAASSLYGKDSNKITALPKGQTSSLVSSVLTPILEESVLDPNFIIPSLRGLLEGSQTSKAEKVKSTAKNALVSFLASHVAATPLLRVRLCLLPVFAVVNKTTSSARANNILPVVRTWCSLNAQGAALATKAEDLDVLDADKGHIASIMAREADSVELLKDFVSGSLNTDRANLLDVAFDRLAALWPNMKIDSRVALGQALLDAALKEGSTSVIDETRRARSLETLRTIKLDTTVLLDFIESVPAAVQMPEGPPAKKRRRTSRNEMARLDVQSADDVTRLVRKLTLVLELIEGSNPGEHTELFKNIFSILGDLQHLQQQTGSDLVYLHSLILGSLTPMVNQLKTMSDTADQQAAVRADLLIDCIRHSESPQVQNAALLLIAGLASWVPELVLHNLMPIFTFIGATLLKQNDDYSAHVVDQTISRVVPQLASSLRSKHKNLLTGVADLLLSFTAAFEHIPQHRKLKLFSELARTLGPQDSLSAIIALLVDMYPTSPATKKFIPELLLKFEPAMTLEAFRGYLSLVVDAASPKRTVSDTLFGLREKQPAQVENTVNTLLSSLADLATNKSVQGLVNKAFRKSRDSTKPRAIFADIVETTIRLSKTVANSKRTYETCSRVLAKCLDLLPTADLVRTAELLLANPDHQVAIAVIKSVEIRAGHVVTNDQQSVDCLLSFLPRLDTLLQQPAEVDVKAIVVSCIDRIVERFGKKDVAAVGAVARTVSGKQSLLSSDDRVRILSLLCLTSMVDVLRDEAISLLPTVLPTAFNYLKESISSDNNGLHNAVFSLLSDVVERLAFVFTREYMVPALELAHRSAVSDMDEACDESREQFYQVVATHIGAQEAFAAIKETWPSAIENGYEAAVEHLQLLAATIDHQTKVKLIKTSSSLFGLFSDLFNVRRAIRSRKSDNSIDEDEIGELETSLVDSVIAMTLKLNDATFRPFFVQLVDSASADEDEELGRSITLCKFLATFFDKLKSIVTSYSSYTLDHLVYLLQHLVSHPASLTTTLPTSLFPALLATFAHDQDSFWQAPSHYTTILFPLLATLTLNAPTLITTHIIPTIVELAAASSSSLDNHRNMNSILLKYMRAEEAHTRLSTVLLEQALTKRLGEEWLALLPEMLPFISELREDDEESVERETQRWIGMVEEVLGEDLEGMLQ
ncbi:U3 small nucleolar RNA-associated protein 10 [Sporormia fimetaria CBS 119925]|uniref:U3 small nucleolar RNA-associated protein 10 n=1 Tax=Sporormia fimetaria CBS 119925 TaxID=1340428 RepID=A0A6A6VJ28_9PLEO|nr:U3 small nucleolar RNA-associated protein 10 [Sporormia fimetaria CBS 119925]